jgi:4-aminobutyrate aminotransferase-like enzyme
MLHAVICCSKKNQIRRTAQASIMLKKEAGRRGLILPAGQGWFGNTIRMAPSVVMTMDQIDQALTIMDDSFGAIS